MCVGPILRATSGSAFEHGPGRRDVTLLQWRLQRGKTEISATEQTESERFLQELRAAGRESLRAIAAGLEERGIPAARGGKWSAVQVARLLEAAAVPFGVSAAAAVA